jgi:8-oxo-dGTP pyrophosphatase MutT (NUDIX family)
MAPYEAFTFAPDLAPLNVPSTTYIPAHPPATKIRGTVLVFAPPSLSPVPKLLLLQRAATTPKLPGLFEPPGGKVETTDASVMAGAARELYEEAGLRAKRFVRLVSPPEGMVTGDPRMAKLTFEVEVWEAEAGDGVRLEPREHQGHVWVTEEEVRRERIGDQTLGFVSGILKAVLLRAFEERRTG